MPFCYSFSMCHTAFFCLFPPLLTYFVLIFIVKYFDSLLIPLCIYFIDILFVVIMGITFNILKLYQSNFDLYQHNFNGIQKTTHPHFSPFELLMSDYIFIYCVSNNLH